LRVHALLKAFPAEALRLALLSAHYRQPLDWSHDLVTRSVRTLDRLYATLRDLDDVPATPVLPAEVDAALADDLNTPQALAELAALASAARRATTPQQRTELKSALLGAGAALGLLKQSPADWFSRGGTAQDDQQIQALVDARTQAKQARDFARADALRQQLHEAGIRLEDSPQGTRWQRN
jgi:cysteinyl-tRNA synthetase